MGILAGIPAEHLASFLRLVFLWPLRIFRRGRLFHGHRRRSSVHNFFKICVSQSLDNRIH